MSRYGRKIEVLPMAIKIEDQFFSQKHVTEEDVKLFADISGDHNPLHLDAEFASKTMFKQRIIHGMLTASLISAALASMPGTIILLNFCLSFEKPVYIGDDLTAKVTVKKIENSKIYLDAEVTRGKDRVVSGTVKILKR
jgi:3-hydroxybutyryl-CoA dehydratase